MSNQLQKEAPDDLFLTKKKSYWASLPPPLTKAFHLDLKEISGTIVFLRGHRKHVIVENKSIREDFAAIKGTNSRLLNSSINKHIWQTNQMSAWEHRNHLAMSGGIFKMQEVTRSLIQLQNPLKIKWAVVLNQELWHFLTNTLTNFYTLHTACCSEVPTMTLLASITAWRSFLNP